MIPNAPAIDPDRLDLAREFRDNPFGRRSADLDALLEILRGPRFNAGYVAVCVEQNKAWALGRRRGIDVPPELVDDTVYPSVAEVEFAAFKRRWEAAAGATLPMAPAVVPGARAEIRPPLVWGYADPWIVAPGETARFRISTRGGKRRYRAALLRVLSSDTGPGGSGLRTEPVAWDGAGEREGAERAIPSGSFVLVEREDALAGHSRFTVQALIMPTLPGGGRQAVLGNLVVGSTAPGFALFLDEAGALACVARSEAATVSTGTRLLAGRWYHVAASVDLAAGRILLRQTPLPARGFDAPRAASAEGRVPPGGLAGAPLRIGAAGVAGAAGSAFATWHFNGRIEAPSLASRALSAAELEAAATSGSTAPAADATIATWDFADGIPTTRAADRGPRGLHGVTVNAPKRAVPGARWDGTAYDWRTKPAHYAAIHFHDDDLYDCRWPADLEWRVPNGQRSGVYALRLEAEGGPEFWATFFVRPPRGRAPKDKPRAAFLASTATYQVYANYRARMVPSTTDLSMGALTQIDVTDVLGMLHYGLGGSTYDKHRDGTGVCHVSPLRPHVNVRPSQARVWNLFIDLCLIDWLEAEGFDYDVITDHDLHKDGAALLDGYAAVMTGCHPEYWSAAMLDATEEWLGRGGRFMYLGGNGLYWRISFPDSHPGMIEVRRAEGGTRAWAEQVGETHHASTGEHGGLWRHSGRAPNLIAGVGFVAQGFDSASFYRRTAASRDPRASWIFEGVEGETIGDFGVALGGAAGMEIDASNVALGTPAHALVVAASEGHTRSMNYVLEEMNAGFTGPHGQSWPAVRAELVFFETPSGGAVFSTGSISWLGSLGHAGRRNPVARLTGNVLRRFIDPAPFAMPGGGRK